jgi:hypothetical protein
MYQPEMTPVSLPSIRIHLIAYGEPASVDHPTHVQQAFHGILVHFGGVLSWRIDRQKHHLGVLKRYFHKCLFPNEAV